MKTPEFDLQKIKSELSVIEEAAKILVSGHVGRPVHALKDAPYDALVRNAVNDLLRLEAKGFQLIRK